MFWKPAVAVQADVGTFLVELSEAADGLKWDPEWVELLQKRDKEKELATEKVIVQLFVSMPHFYTSFCRFTVGV